MLKNASCVHSAILVATFAVCGAGKGYADTEAHVDSEEWRREESQWQCSTRYDGGPYAIKEFQVRLREDVAELTFELHAEVKATYRLDTTYRPRTEETKQFHRFLLDETDLFLYPDGPITTIYLERRLFSGETQGKMRMPGHGYSWQVYLCQQVPITGEPWVR